MGKLNRSPGLRKRGESWVIDRVIRGRRIYESLGPVDLATAEEVLAKRITEAATGELLPHRRACSLTVRDLLNIYWQEHLRHKRYGAEWRYILTAIDKRIGDAIVMDLRKTDIETYKRLRRIDRNKQGNPISWRTVEAELKTLSSAINHAVDNETLTANKIAKFCTVPKAPPTRIVLDEGAEYGKEWLALYGAASPSFRPALVTLYETGMRPVELTRMSWSWIKKVSNEHWIINIPGDADKTGRAREVPVSEVLRRELLRQIEFSIGGFVFPGKDGFQRKDFRRQWLATLSLSGIINPGLSLYALRRTRITIWDAIDGEACRYAVGHVPRDVHSRCYLRITKERLFKLVGGHLNDLAAWNLRDSGVANAPNVQ